MVLLVDGFMLEINLVQYFNFLLNAEISSISAALQYGSIMDGVWYEHRRKSIVSAA